jgi:hypothetical protein
LHCPREEICEELVAESKSTIVLRGWLIEYTLRNASNVSLSEIWISIADYTFSIADLGSIIGTTRDEHTGTGPIYFYGFKIYVVGSEEPCGVIL